MKKFQFWLTVLFIGLVAGQGWSQDTIVRYAQVKTLNGDTFTGKIIEKTDEVLTITTVNVGEISIKMGDIKKLKEFTNEEMRDGLYWFENPNATRNVYGPTGYSLKKGEGYYQNFMIFLNSVSYGFTDNFTVRAGLIPVTFGEGLMFSITPKFSIPIVENKFNVGTGILYTHTFGENMGIGYGVATLGSRDNNLTLGMGYGVVNDDWSKAPIITFSGMMRIARKFSLVSENWLIPYRDTQWEYNQNTGESILVSENTRYNLFFSYGIRFMSEQVTIDLAFVNISEEAIFPGIPLLGVVIPFGNR
ncbi:MAG: hypothetical protein AB8G22_16975 [Saprospiraceae bacterium]